MESGEAQESGEKGGSVGVCCCRVLLSYLNMRSKATIDKQPATTEEKYMLFEAIHTTILKGPKGRTERQK